MAIKEQVVTSLDHPDVQDAILPALALREWLPRNERAIMRAITCTALRHVKRGGLLDFPPELQSPCLRTELEESRRQIADPTYAVSDEHRTCLARLGHVLVGMDDQGHLEPPLDEIDRFGMSVLHAHTGISPEDDAI